MRRTGLEARRVFGLLAVALTLTAAMSAALSFSSSAGAAAKGKIVLAWHAGIASRWLDPQEHDGTATPDNFLTAIHDALIKNQGTALYDHPALAERFAVAADSKSATFTLRKGIKFHNGDPVTPQDVKFSYENYRGAKADVFKRKTERVEIRGRPHDPLPLQRALPRFRHPLRHRECRRRRLGGA
jgi:peptide/nickel transport system substrate-binding protein